MDFVQQRGSSELGEKMMKKTMLAVFLIMLCAVALSDLAPISTQRSVASELAAGEKLSVEVNLKFIGEKPSGIIVTEYIPAGWEVTSSVPAASKFDGKISWVLYGEKVKNAALVYEIKSPANFSKEVLLRGNWETITSSGITAGDNSIRPAKSAQLPAQQGTQAGEVAKTDNTLLYVGGGIILLLVIIIGILVMGKAGNSAKPQKKK